MKVFQLACQNCILLVRWKFKRKRISFWKKIFFEHFFGFSVRLLKLLLRAQRNTLRKPIFWQKNYFKSFSIVRWTPIRTFLRKIFSTFFKVRFCESRQTCRKSIVFFGKENLFVFLFSKNQQEFFYFFGQNFSSQLPKLHST